VQQGHNDPKNVHLWYIIIMTDYGKQITRELSQAETARAQGLEGRARVCARRAAGLAVRAYLEQREEAVTTVSAVELLQSLSVRSELPPEAHRAAEFLLLRVTPEYHLPVAVDLIAESRRLADILLVTR
jgi:hypothetical protein